MLRHFTHSPSSLTRAATASSSAACGPTRTATTVAVDAIRSRRQPFNVHVAVLRCSRGIPSFSLSSSSFSSSRCVGGHGGAYRVLGLSACLPFSAAQLPRVAALSVTRRHAANQARSGGKDIDIVDQEKPIHIRVAEQKDSQIYTYTEYVEKFENEERAGKTISEALSEARDNPAWMLWALGLLSLAVVTVVVSIRVRREQMRFDPKLRAVKSFDSDDGPSIGGPFSLTDVNTGKKVTDQDFRGKWMYIYFGFTNCPDVCPEEMEKMSRVIAHLDKKVGKDYWQPIFVSLDPKRDTPKAIREYLADFSPRILGLVGTQEEVEEAARQYRVYFAIPDEEAMSEDDYLVDHSIIMYLMDSEGSFSDYTTKEFQWFESYSKLLRRMMDYEKDRQQRSLPADPKVARVGSVVAPAEDKV